MRQRVRGRGGRKTEGRIKRPTETHTFARCLACFKVNNKEELPSRLSLVLNNFHH